MKLKWKKFVDNGQYLKAIEYLHKKGDIDKYFCKIIIDAYIKYKEYNK